MTTRELGFPLSLSLSPFILSLYICLFLPSCTYSLCTQGLPRYISLHLFLSLYLSLPWYISLHLFLSLYPSLPRYISLHLSLSPIIFRQLHVSLFLPSFPDFLCTNVYLGIKLLSSIDLSLSLPLSFKAAMSLSFFFSSHPYSLCRYSVLKMPLFDHLLLF